MKTNRTIYNQVRTTATFAAILGVALAVHFTARSACPVPDFGPPAVLAQGANPRDVVAADFTGDGLLDLATANSFSSTVSVLTGNGKGRFARLKTFAAGDGAIALAVGDFNGDGKLDIVTANNNGNSVSLLLGDGAGGFSAPASFPVAGAAFAIAVGDFNHDGNPD